MSEFVVMVFPDEQKAYAGLHALTELHTEGTVSVYATAVVRREPNGTLAIKQQSDDGPVGTALGMLVGALVGVFAGPVGVAAGVAGGAMLGGARDLLHLSVSDDFLLDAEKELTPGKYAVVAEVAEDWTAPLDIRMEALGGKVIRQDRDDFIDEQLQRRADEWRHSVKQWNTDRETSRAVHAEQRLDAHLKREQKRLQDMADKAKTKIQERKTELGYQISALQAQAAKASPEARHRIDERMSLLRRDLDEREHKLTRAYELAREALQPH